MRLDKLISETGTASRRDAARLIKSGLVLVDGMPARSGSDKVDPQTQQIIVSGTRIEYKTHRYLMMNKPAGVVSSTDDHRDKTAIELLGPPYDSLGLFPAGRLDKDAEGLLLLTDDGAWAHRVISPSKHVWKTYDVRVDGLLDHADVDAFAAGMTLKSGVSFKPAGLEILSSGAQSLARVKLREGKYHQIKRMFAARGKTVVYLRRVAVGALRLDDDLPPGGYRELTQQEADAVFVGSAEHLTT